MVHLSQLWLRPSHTNGTAIFQNLRGGGGGGGGGLRIQRPDPAAPSCAMAKQQLLL